jgi:pullulanase/glycogen debranching enzyme
MLKLQSAESTSLAEQFGVEYFGCIQKDDTTSFRVFCPRSTQVELVIFQKPDDPVGTKIPMSRLQTGVWEYSTDKPLPGNWYGYKIAPPSDDLPWESTDEIIADPYSKWVCTTNDYAQHPKSLIFNMPDFDWEGDRNIGTGDPRDLIIYEAHIQDLTQQLRERHPNKSHFELLSEEDNNTLIQYLKSLNINAIEFLPLQKFSYHEPPFNQATSEGVRNTWNPYSVNYWGYMTSFFFMPESRFSELSELKGIVYYGLKPDGINALKNLVKTLHKNGISVIMDVVYNHASQYDLNPLKYLDRFYYFRHDADHKYTSHSGCGNDLRTEAPFARRMIIDSILYWMKEFHIDGFRLDLANLLDRDTLIKIREEARKVNPNVILIAEPWGGGYNPVGFSEIGWPSWNDQIRNGIKGSDPVYDSGLIFGSWQRETSRLSVENFIRGTLLNQPNGRYKRSMHSVNYLESHDGYTLGDFIRIVYNPELLDTKIPDKKLVLNLEGPELNSARLAAFILFISQGVTMIHAGQEFARSKWISAQSGITDHEVHKLDHNSYNKDNDTNYIDWSDVTINEDLLDYYKGLIKLRSSSPALRKAIPESISFHNYDDPLHFSFTIRNHETSDIHEYFVSFNANPYREHTSELPEGFWEIMVTQTHASHLPISIVNGILKVGPLSGILARRVQEQVNHLS